MDLCTGNRPPVPPALRAPCRIDACACATAANSAEDDATGQTRAEPTTSSTRGDVGGGGGNGVVVVVVCACGGVVLVFKGLCCVGCAKLWNVFKNRQIERRDR